MRCSSADRARALLVALAAILPAGVEAQPVVAGHRFNFNFSNPGARSLGFGGAFAALADDATASVANPAGLVQLTRPEVSVEWRRWDRSPSFLAGGELEVPFDADGAVARLLLGRDRSEELAPSFSSAVLPRGRWSFAVFGHRLARFEMASESQGFFVFDDPPEVPIRTPATREEVDLEIVSGGLTAAWRMTDRLLLGVSAVQSEISLTTLTTAYRPDPDRPLSPIPLIPERLVSTGEMRIDDVDWTLHAGALWSVNHRFSAGLFYRQGAEVAGTERVVEGIGDQPVTRTARPIFAVPDVWGAGAAYSSHGGALTVAGEIDRVGYSGMLRGRIEEDETGARSYRDAWEYHLGAEYALLQRRPIVAFRLGAWVEAGGDEVIEERFTHLAVGLGIAAERFQIDLAADFSDEIDTGSVSFIYAF